MSNQSFCRGPLPPPFQSKPLPQVNKPPAIALKMNSHSLIVPPTVISGQFETRRRWDPANIFCKYLGQYFFEAHHRWGPADIFQLVTKLENPSWTKTHTDWSKFSCSFFCEYSWCGTKELLAWDNIDQFLHKIRSSTVKFFLESSEYCDKLVYEKIEEKNTLLHWIVSIQGCVRMLQSCLYQQKGNWNIAIVWTYSSGHLYSHWNNCQLIRDGDVMFNEGIFEQSVAKKIAA